MKLLSNNDILRLLNLFIGLYNIYLWNIGGFIFNFIIGCINVGAFVFGKK